MPKSQLEIDIEKATNENMITDDWGLILDIIDQINKNNSEKEAIKIVTRRLNDRDPHVINNALTLLNACMMNCNRNFRLVVCSRIFIDELKNFILKPKYQKLKDKLLIMIKNWSNESEFQNDPELNLMPSLYANLVKSGVEFPKEEKSNMKSTSSASVLQKKEEEDLARAIQLSIKESNAKAPSKQQKQQKSHDNEVHKVKALYDFEAVEENELTFKAGDILYVTDNSDQNWWKGYDKSGKEGLFPSNFVTSDLQYEVEVYEPTGPEKKVSFNNNINVNEFGNDENNIVVIDEKKIDECIEMLQNADPTGEIQPDTQEMINLEENCYLMGPLIDQQLQRIDQKHAILEDLNLKILEAFQMYNNLMKDSLTKVNPMLSNHVYNANNNIMSNYLSNSTYQSNSNPISFVTAPPQSDSTGHLLANQLTNFAPSTNQQIPTMHNMNLPYGVPAQQATNYPNYSSFNSYTDYNLQSNDNNMKPNLDPAQLQQMTNPIGMTNTLPNENKTQPMLSMDSMLSMQYAKPPTL